jgi:hypothetical protein
MANIDFDAALESIGHVDRLRSAKTTVIVCSRAEAEYMARSSYPGKRARAVSTTTKITFRSSTQQKD